MKLLMVAAASLAVVSCASLSLEDLEFHAWKLKFGKVYSSPEEEARRKDIWLSTRRRVLAHNILADQGIKTYRMGMNHFSDMDPLEFIALHGILLPKDFLNSTAQHAVKSPRPLDGTEQKKSVDWRDTGCVAPIKNQGNCGSCWAFSAVGALESHTCLKHQQNRPIELSEQQLVDCSRPNGNYGCTMGYVWKAFEYCEFNSGIVTEEFYPYVGQELTCHFTQNNPVPDNQIGARCSGYTHLQEDEPSLQRAVADVGPVAVTVPLHPSFYSYDSGVYYEPNCHTPPPKNAHHIMLVVGYGTTRNGEDYWLVRNSWSTTWGEEGYIKMARNKNNHCGIANYAYYPLVE